ncbi:hypothetical protein LDENG_00057490, partial [Lucifuga dentata]
MSHNYPHRRPLPPHAAGPRPDPGTYSSTDRRYSSTDFYRQPHDSSSHLWSSSPSSSHTSSPSPRGSGQSAHPVRWSADGALSILSSCGLEPSDLSVLAELPEDVLTVESLPHVLKQIKGKREVTDPYPPRALSSSSPSSSSRLQTAASSSSSQWDCLQSRPVRYQLDNAVVTTPKPLSPEHVHDWQGCWVNPLRSNSSSRVDSPLPSSSSAYVVDYNHRMMPSEYGKKETDSDPVNTGDWPAYSSLATGNGSRTRPSRFSQPKSADYRSAPSPEVHPKTTAQYHRSATASSNRSQSSSSSSSSSIRLSMTPSKKEALDFHGKMPPTYPYSCSLCGIAVLSDKVWIQHISGTQHADGQLTLLQ